MFSSPIEVPSVPVLKIPNSRLPLPEGTEPGGLLGDILRANPNVEYQGSSGNTIISADALAPHAYGDHRILWFKNSDNQLLGWDEALTINGLWVIKDVLKREYSKIRPGENLIIGMNLGHEEQFSDYLESEDSVTTSYKSGAIQSIPYAHIHLIHATLEEQPIDRKPVNEALAPYYKLYDFAGEAATQYFLEELKRRFEDYSARESKLDVNGFNRTIFKFDSLGHAINAAWYIQHSNPLIRERWNRLSPMELKTALEDSLREDSPWDLKDFEKYGKQFRFPCTIVGKRINYGEEWNDEWILVPFASGPGAAELFGGYALEREYQIKP